MLLVCLLTTYGRPQKISNFERERAKDMLSDIAADIRKHYYDPKFHGVDWDAKVKEAKEKIDHVETQNMAFSQIAAALDSLNDSHTYFVPPSRPYRHDYGWHPQMIGDRCFVVRVRPSSDAEAKGMKPGDEVLTINGFVPNRDSLWRINYVFNVLRPQSGLRVKLRHPSEPETQLDALAKIIPTRRVSDLRTQEIWDFVRQSENEEQRARLRSVELGNDLTILKLPRFFFSESELDGMLGKARKRPNLILDLRNNGGGAVDDLKYLVGGTFDHEVKSAIGLGGILTSRWSPNLMGTRSPAS
jgi:C-terminal processing protease CtpA/Prc